MYLDLQPSVPNQAHSSGAFGGEFVARVEQTAPLQAEAAAADTAIEAVAEPLDLADLLVEAFTPVPRETGPVCACRRTFAWEFREGVAYLCEIEADLLRSPDKRHAAKSGACVSPLVARSPLGTDESERFVVAQCRRRDTRPLRELSDRQQMLVSSHMIQNSL